MIIERKQYLNELIKKRDNGRIKISIYFRKEAILDNTLKYFNMIY